MPTFTVVISNERHPAVGPAYSSGSNVIVAFCDAARIAALYPVVYFDGYRHERLFEKCRKVMRRHSPEAAVFTDGPLSVSVTLHP